MRNILISVFTVILCPGLTLGGAFMGVEEITPGMKGIGKTVFRGGEVEEFGVEIIGVLKGARVKGDIILARLSGGPLEKTGIISGMSGSPVYIDSKLIGAVAYRWGTFAKEPLCGITPISEMLDVARGEGSLRGEIPPSKDWTTIPEQGLAAIESPLISSGLDERTVSYVEPRFRRFGLFPVMGGESAEGIPTPKTLQPGSSLGIQFIRGDLSLSAMGTLTHVDGERVLAFGHPITFSGSTELPMITGWVHGLLPSQLFSFKIFSSTEIVGTIEEDRMGGTSGTLGRLPQLLPLELTIDGEAYNFELAKEPTLIPYLTGLTTFNSILNSARFTGDLTASISLQVNLKGFPEVVVKDIVSGGDTPLRSGWKVEEILRLIAENRFEEVSFESIALSISLREERLTAAIEGVRIANQVVRPGDTLELSVSLRSYQGELTQKTVRVEIPEEVPVGEYTLRVANGTTYWEQERQRVPLRFEPKDLPGLLSLIEEVPRGDEVFCQLYSSSPGVTVRGEELPSLPPSVISTIRTSKQSGEETLTSSSLVALKRFETEFLVSGEEEIKFKVSRQ